MSISGCYAIGTVPLSQHPMPNPTKRSNKQKFRQLSMQINPLVSIFSSSKDFRAPWIGNHRLNRMGLHLLRMQMADLLHRLRHVQRPAAQRWPRLQTLRREGVVVLPDFLPEHAFRSLREEARSRLEQSLEQHPPAPAKTVGFGPKQPFNGGFDRYDGDTLNRFLDIQAGQSPEAFRVVRNDRLLALCSAAQTRPASPEKFSLYYTRSGNGDGDAHDLQRDLHRDTFHHAIKLWLFLDDVSDSDGPFVYVPGSHRMTPARKSWERYRSIRATHPDSPDRSSSFRASLQEIREMGYADPQRFPVRGNTLIIADTLGFHARGDAAPGSERLALYGAFRPWPFNLLAH